MGATMAADLDGIVALFYKPYREIVKNDIIATIKNFLRSGCLLKELNLTHFI